MTFKNQSIKSGLLRPLNTGQFRCLYHKSNLFQKFLEMWKYRSYYEFVTVNAFVSIGLNFQVAEITSKKTMLEELKIVCGHVFRAIKLLKLPHFERNLSKVFLKFSLEIFSTIHKAEKKQTISKKSFGVLFGQNCQASSKPPNLNMKELTIISKTVQLIAKQITEAKNKYS